MSSKRFNKLIADKNQNPETFSKLISEIKKIVLQNLMSQ